MGGFKWGSNYGPRRHARCPSTAGLSIAHPCPAWYPWRKTTKAKRTRLCPASYDDLDGYSKAPSRRPFLPHVSLSLSPSLSATHLQLQSTFLCRFVGGKAQWGNFGAFRASFDYVPGWVGSLRSHWRVLTAGKASLTYAESSFAGRPEAKFNLFKAWAAVFFYA